MGAAATTKQELCHIRDASSKVNPAWQRNGKNLKHTKPTTYHLHLAEEGSQVHTNGANQFTKTDKANGLEMDS